VDSIDFKNLKHACSRDTNAMEVGEVPLLGLGSLASLRIDDDAEACDSCVGLDSDDVSFIWIVMMMIINVFYCQLQPAKTGFD